MKGKGKVKKDTDSTIEETSYEVECFMDEKINAKYKRYPIKKPLTVKNIINCKKDARL